MLNKSSATLCFTEARCQCWRGYVSARGLVFFWVCVWFGVASAFSQPTEIRTVAEVRQLAVEEAAQKRPVRLRGVVTFFEQSLYSRFLQDETAGVYLFDSGLPVHFFPGQTVEVVGTTGAGEYAPIVIPQDIQLIGDGVMPAPRAVTYEQLTAGNEDSQFVEISGVVRSVTYQESTQFHLIEIATGGGRLSVYARQLPVSETAQMVDSTVRVRGVCSTLFNRQRQLFAIRLMVPRAEDVVVEVPAATDPFAIPSRTIGSLLQYTPHEAFGHRVKVEGTVTHFQPGRMLYIQNGDQGLEVQTASTQPLNVGDRIEVLGFPSRGDYTPVIQDATYRVMAAGSLMAAAEIKPDEALKGTKDCCLVRLTARLLGRAQSGQERYLILAEGGQIFQAQLLEAGGADSLAHLSVGSRVAVVGVCKISPDNWEAGEEWRAKSFRVLLRSAADVEVLVLPPWWTLQKVLWVAGALGFVAVAAFTWVVVLRRRVAERTQQLELEIHERQQAERRREIEQERARVAHDLHDDLGARLTEVNMLGTLIKSPTTSPEEKDRYLTELSGTASEMITSLDEIVWAVNPRNDTTSLLASYFGSYAQRLLELASISCGLDVAEDLPEHSLDPKFRRELFLAFKEALTNVVRHSKATQVWLRIRADGGMLTVEVADNGRGIESGVTAPGADGIANMKERLISIGGQCDISSDAASGTMVRFTAALPVS